LSREFKTIHFYRQINFLIVFKLETATFIGLILAYYNASCIIVLKYFVIICTFGISLVCLVGYPWRVVVKAVNVYETSKWGKCTPAERGSIRIPVNISTKGRDDLAVKVRTITEVLFWSWGSSIHSSFFPLNVHKPFI
jgi:hypothetical protein